MAKSEALFARDCKVIPGGVNSPVRCVRRELNGKADWFYGEIKKLTAASEALEIRRGFFGEER